MTTASREEELLAEIDAAFRRKVDAMPGTPKEEEMSKSQKLEQVVIPNRSTLLVRKGEAVEDVQARMTEEALEAERARADAGESVVS